MNKKIYLPNYNNCIVNLSCSIKKQFGLTVSHPTLNLLDEYLESDKKNIILLVYDGLGTNVLNSCLRKKDFLRSNVVSNITSVFPPTTTAATTSIMAGLYPFEHGWLGWDIYFRDIDKIVSVFGNYEKDNEKKIFDYNVAKKYLNYDKIVDEINNKTQYNAFELLPFENCKYDNLDAILDEIVNITKHKGKKFIYAYYKEPDHILHRNGILSKKTKKLVSEINMKTQNMTKKLDDYILIITADHGHHDCEVITLINRYPDIISLLKRNISTEGRACSFWIKDGKKDEFEKKFNEYWGKDFILFSKDELLKNDLFGYGEKNKNLDYEIGDYMAVAIGNKYFEYYDYEDKLISHHAGLTKEEILVPLIITSD